MNELRELHLFAGCGGGVLAGKLLGHRCIGYVEREPYRCRVLAQRIKDGILDDSPIYCGTVREFIDCGYAAAYSGLVEVLCAGFPCPPFSLAGKRLADKDPRNAWPETRDAIEIIRPRFAFLENVPGLITSPYLKKICGDLQSLGYRIRATVLGAVDVKAPHLRKRAWMLAYTNFKHRDRRSEQSVWEAGNRGMQEGWKATPDRGETLAYSPMPGRSDGGQVQARREQSRRDSFTRCSWWDSEPGLGRVADGVADRVERLEAIGDGQVPLVAALAFRILSNGLI